MKGMFVIIFLLVFFSSSAQIIWEMQDSGTIHNLNSVDFFNAETGMAVGDEGTILRTEDGGETWLLSESGTTADLYSVCFFNENEAVAVGASATLIRTENGGMNWSPITVIGLNYDMFSVFIHPEGNGIAGGAAQTILSTDDGGLTWNIKQTDYWGGGFWGAHMVDNVSGFLAGENSIMAPLLAFTANGGDSFNFEDFYLVDGGVSHEGRALNCHSFSGSEGIVVSRRWDGWGCITQVDLPDFATNHYTNLYNSVDFADTDFGMVVGNNGSVIITENGGNDWESETAVFGHFMDVDLPVDHNLAYVVGQQGVIARRRAEVSSPETEIPGIGVKLWSQPNPVYGKRRNSGTRIIFELPKSGEIELNIYNIKGQLQEKLAAGDFTAGRHDVHWNADRAAAGIYVCLLKSGSATYAYKIVKIAN
ncbi:MAG: hypothetical protein APR54_04510 [Candidatus Cloacimonas sp. SDB]|nr:MAG: hypothetical protein APR54_04510 [Candidatus Cloacimonas sp. SDB]